MPITRTETSPVLLNKLNSKNGDDAKLKKACQDFEAIFTTYMLKTMRTTIPKDVEGASGNQREIFESMFDQALSTEISHSKKALGIGEELYKELSKRKNGMNK
jgi:flagellar protein FlgJ